jgi:tetratricopeptide (TPR) repeat protein
MTADDAPKTAILNLVHRETILLAVLCAIAVVAYFGTRAVAQANRRLNLADAARWYAAGEAHARAEQPQRAAAAFRRAIALDPSRREYRLALADALTASHDDEAARFVLQQLRDLDPDDAQRTRALQAHQPANTPSIEALGRIVDEIATRDPLSPHLAVTTRRQRVRALLDDLHTELAGCGDFALAREAEQAAADAHRRHSASNETIESELATAARLAERAPQPCRDQPLTRAVVLIARRHGIAIS